MKILVDRKWKKPTYTIGKCYIDGKEFSETIEDKDRGLSNNMSETYIKSQKIYGKTAIPTGTYELKFTLSPKFANRAWAKSYNGKVPQIMNVKGFQGIRIHPLNTAEDSLGCIGLGRNLKKGMVLNSTEYYKRFVKDYIYPAVQRGEKITIEIK